MRRRDFRGQKECTGVWLDIKVRIWRREVGWKIEGSRRFYKTGVSDVEHCGKRPRLTVIRRVFDGGEGEIRGGRVERSRERGLSVASLSGVDAAENGGDALGFDMFGVELGASSLRGLSALNGRALEHSELQRCMRRK